MILYKSALFDTARQDAILAHLESYINRVRATLTLPPEAVVQAVDRLGSRIAAGEFDPVIARIASPEDVDRYRTLAVGLMSRDALEARLEKELGGPLPDDPASPIRQERRPLGTLFHIAAGNMDGLPAYSVVEGLCAGNFNILKLPSSDDGVTVEILSALIREEPLIGDFVAVFDTPSTDTEAMRKMAALADGIVVWGSEAAITAVRTLAPPGVKLIEWGHRLGFAYVSGTPSDKDLASLAGHIAETKQLLCSSAQVIYLDTASMPDLGAFAERFLPFLDEATAAHPVTDLGAMAQITTRRRCRELADALGEQESGEVIRGSADCSLILCRDSALELSPLWGNVLVKRLPRANLLPVLRTAKGTLQTAALLCPEEERAALTEVLIRSGVNRVTRAGDLSATFPGEAHDGELPLRRYTRIVDIEK
ncbi:MAG: acyl-CoA reductase [Clostridia bacterium]|nr:acyl-CoA reductase [Clostridia bacterium]